MGKLKEFIDENINWEGTKATVPAGHIVTEAVVMFRLVKINEETGELSEQYEYVSNRGASFAMIRGIADCVFDQWEFQIIDKLASNANAQEDDEDDGT